MYNLDEAATALRVTSALGVRPGLITVTAISGKGGQLQYHGRHELVHLNRDFGMDEFDATIATQGAFAIAERCNIPLLIRYLKHGL